MIRQQLLRYFSRYIRDLNTVEDLVQETYLAVFSAGKSEETFGYYLTIAKNLLRIRHRKSIIDKKHLAEYAKIAPAEHVDAQNMGEVVDRVRGALANIKPVQAKVLHSLIIDGESSRQLGKALGRSHFAIWREAKKGKEDFKRLIGNPDDLL